MMMDPIADLLTRLRNAYLARNEVVTVPYSRLKQDILHILKKNKYIADFELIENSTSKKELKVSLNNVRKTLYIPTFRRISRPGQRIYLGSRDITKSRNGKGIYIISTPKGVITGYEAFSLKVGGELLCEVY
ncbi:30S ribosomal protein S8 [Candidatus Gracilibacteria bacterium]|nr:30S ribosomal protein S8 [Candidatus Gracilibacteria bacterium]